MRDRLLGFALAPLDRCGCSATKRNDDDKPACHRDNSLKKLEFSSTCAHFMTGVSGFLSLCVKPNQIAAVFSLRRPQTRPSLCSSMGDP